MSEWPYMRVGWGLLVLIRVVKGFVPKLSKGEIVNVIVRLAILDKIPKCLLAMVL